VKKGRDGERKEPNVRVSLRSKLTIRYAEQGETKGDESTGVVSEDGASTGGVCSGKIPELLWRSALVLQNL